LMIMELWSNSSHNSMIIIGSPAQAPDPHARGNARAGSVPKGDAA